MPDGYLRGGRPDTGWWVQQIFAGIEYRKQKADEWAWERWRAYYRGQWNKSVMPINIFFTMARTLIPRVYFRNPSVSVSPAMPGPDVMVFAQALQRIDNRLLHEMRAKREFKRMVHQAFMFGTGIGKLGFGAVHQPTPDPGFTGQPISFKGERFEYRDAVFDNMPWFGSVPAGRFIVPDGLRVWQDARWCAHWERRSVEDVKADPRFKNTKDLGSSVVMTHLGGVHTNIEMVDLVEVRDKKMGRVHVIVPYSNDQGRELFSGDDEFLNNGAFNFYPVIFNEDDEHFWGIPDARIIEPYQLELNEINTQIMKHRRLTLVKLLYREGYIDEEELEKMMNEDVAAGVKIKGDLEEAVKPTQAADIPQSLILAKRETMENFREALGFSRNQFGEYKPGSNDVSATESMIVKMASEIRVDEKRDIIADAMVEMVEGMHTIIFNHWRAEQVVQILGPGGIPIWLRFQAAAARNGKYLTKVDPDTSLPETKDIRTQRAERVYALLRDNPIVDPIKLTQFLLHEMHGVEFDDLMRVLPAPDQVPNQPITASEYGGLLSSSMKLLSDQSTARQQSNPGNGTATPLQSQGDGRAAEVS